MNSKSRVITVKITDDMLETAKKIAKETSSTISEIMRRAFNRFSRTELVILKAKKSLNERGIDKVQLIHFPCQKSQIRLAIHKNAFKDIRQISKDTDLEPDILDFFNKNIDTDILKIGDVHNEGDEKFVVFTISTVKACCLIGSYTITLLSVV